jgi:hypothetical protein
VPDGRTSISAIVPFTSAIAFPPAPKTWTFLVKTARDKLSGLKECAMALGLLSAS